MVSATLSVLSRRAFTLTGPECVEKSFPGFWRQVARVFVLLSE